MKAPLIHLASLAFNSPLAILPEKMQILLQTLGPRLTPDTAAIDELLESHVLLTHPERRDDLLKYSAGGWDDEDETLNSRSDKKPYQVTQAGVAIIPVCGVLMKKGSWMSALSGFSSYDGITRAFKGALADSSVRAILFNVDSPGGTTHGCFELADLIHGSRGKKPMFAAANDLAASAAYAIASSADRVFVTRTGAVGSIGVFCLHADVASLDSKLGVKYTYIYFGAKKVDGNEHTALSATARADMQAEVDREGAMFVATVARNRGKSEASILATEAGCLFAEASTPLLADTVGTYDDALAALTSKIGGGSVMITASSGNNSTADKGVTATMPPTTDLATLKANADTANAALLAAQAEQAEKDKADDAAFTARVERLGYVPAKRRAAAPPDGDADDAPPAPKKKTATMPDDPNCDDDAKSKAALAAARTEIVDEASEIAALCEIAGYDGNTPGKKNLWATFVKNKTSKADVMRSLQEVRAKESDATAVTSSFGVVSAASLDTLQQTAAAIVANSNGAILPSKAFEAALKQNVHVYKAYRNEMSEAALTEGRAEAYISLAAARFPAMGLGTGA